MGSEAPNWADQWGSYADDREGDDKNTTSKKKNNKMSEFKALASAGLDKTKTVAVIGAQKLKTGTSSGFKWVKNQYQKKFSK